MSKSRSRFPVQTLHYPGAPRSVPWDFVAPHEERAKRNHGAQSLDTLAQRHGLCVKELLSVVCDVHWSFFVDVEREACVVALWSVLDQWESRQLRPAVVDPVRAAAHAEVWEWLAALQLHEFHPLDVGHLRARFERERGSGFR